MDLISALHTASRQYCIENFSYWRGVYFKLYEQGCNREKDGFHYTKEARSVFSRYNVIQAILIEIEKFIPEDFDTLEQSKELLKEIGNTANSIFTVDYKDDIESQVINEERVKFCSFVSKITTAQLLAIQPLFFRRTLSKEESVVFRERLNNLWHIEKDCWYPLENCLRQDVIAFQDKHFETEVGYENLRNILTKEGIKRVWELREYGAEYEMDVSIFESCYNGAEGFWFSEKTDWVIYASHESSITIGGTWLIEQIKSVWPNWQKRIWDSPFFD